ncbi:MAG: DUF2207 domain-containing protein [Pseudomonadota bacterium]
MNKMGWAFGYALAFMLLIAAFALHWQSKTPDLTNSSGDDGQTAAIAPSGPAEGAERYTNYAMSLHVQKTGEIVVEETITAVVTDDDIRHGITRTIPLIRHHRYGSSRSDFTVLDATLNGQPVDYSADVGGTEADIHLGSPDRLLQPGLYTFTLEYEMDRQVGHFADHDEIYWNAVGFEWEFETEKAVATVWPPEGAKIQSTAVYTGTADGSQGHAATITHGADGQAIFTTTEALAPEEAFTVVVSWPKGFVPEPGWAGRMFGNPWPIFIGVATLGVTLVYFVVVWWIVGRGPPKGPTIPVYAPTLPPHAMRFLDRRRYDTRCLVAAIISICAKGHAVVEDDPDQPKHLVLRPLLPVATPWRRPLTEGEQAVLDILLGDGRMSLSLSSRNRGLLASASLQLQRVVDRRVYSEYIQRNFVYVAVGAIMVLFGWIAVGELGLRDWSDLFHFVASFAVLLFAVWYSVYHIRGVSNSRVIRFLIMVPLSILLVTFVSVFVFLAADAYYQDAGPVALGLLIASMLMIVVFFWILQHPTVAGRQALDEVAGTKLYLTVAEADRLKFENPPDLTPRHFSDLLPYAVALNVQTAWTERFASKVGGLAVVPQPIWYVGSGWSTFDWGSNSGNPFTGSLDGAIRSGIAARAMSPGSGGFAGGGGGGGGSGGW